MQAGFLADSGGFLALVKTQKRRPTVGPTLAAVGEAAP